MSQIEVLEAPVQVPAAPYRFQDKAINFSGPVRDAGRHVFNSHHPYPSRHPGQEELMNFRSTYLEERHDGSTDMPFTNVSPLRLQSQIAFFVNQGVAQQQPENVEALASSAFIEGFVHGYHLRSNPLFGSVERQNEHDNNVSRYINSVKEIVQRQDIAEEIHAIVDAGLQHGTLFANKYVVA